MQEGDEKYWYKCLLKIHTQLHVVQVLLAMLRCIDNREQMAATKELLYRIHTVTMAHYTPA